MGCEAKVTRDETPAAFYQKKNCLKEQSEGWMMRTVRSRKAIARLTADRAVRRKTALTSVGESERDTAIKSLMEFVSEEGV